MTALSPELIQELLKQESTPAQPQGLRYTEPQEGPLRWFDKVMRCASKRCGSPTYCKVEGVPLCDMHALRKLNEMLVGREKNNDRQAAGNVTIIGEWSEDDESSSRAISDLL